MTTIVLSPALWKVDYIEQILKILIKWQNKIDCLIFEMLELKPILKKQCESKSAKLFACDKTILLDY